MIECRDDRGKGGREVALLFRREDLLYDIRNLSYAEGEVMDEKEQCGRHTVQDIGEEGNVDRVTRVLDRCHAECVEMLLPWTEREIDRDCLDDGFKERRVYGIIMKIPPGFSQTTLNLLEELVHDYMVCSVMADWLGIGNPGKAAIWKEKAEELGRGIRSKPRLRVGKLRIRGRWL